MQRHTHQCRTTVLPQAVMRQRAHRALGDARSGKQAKLANFQKLESAFS